MMNARIPVEDQMQHSVPSLALIEINFTSCSGRQAFLNSKSLYKSITTGISKTGPVSTYKRKQFKPQRIVTCKSQCRFEKPTCMYNSGLSQTGNKFADSYPKPH